MAILPTSVDYTDKDFDSLRDRLFNLIRNVFPEWTDENVANFGNILVELFAFVGDVLGFYLDNHARESRITTATQRRSLIGLAKLVGYTPPGAAAATATVTVTLSENAPEDIPIAPGTVFRTNDVTGAQTFQVLPTVDPADLDILTGTNSRDVVVENSTTYTGTAQATGLANQEVPLDNTPYVDDSAVVSDDLGAFTQVDNFLGSDADDRHFAVLIDQNERARLRFGNGTNGVLPSGVIDYSYKTGGGAAGNVEANRIVLTDTPKIERPLAAGQFVTVSSVNNADKASGGADRQSLESIREQTPESTRALTRTVAREDYEIHARAVPGVARALMLTRNESATILENQGRLTIIPDGGGVPTQVLKDAVLTAVTVTYPNTLTFGVTVVDPTYLTVDVATIVQFDAGVSKTTVRAAIQTALDAHFAFTNADGSTNTNVNFGYAYQDADGNTTEALPYSDIYNIIRDVSGVRKIAGQSNGLLLNGVAQDVTVVAAEFPQLGTLTVIDLDTGATVT